MCAEQSVVALALRGVYISGFIIGGSMAKRKLNFGGMDLAELLQLRDEIETALNGKIAMERDELQSKMAELAALERKRSKSVGMMGGGGKALKRGAGSKPHPLKGQKAKPKYRGPTGETWAGRGLPPRWLVNLEKKGKKRDQFLIEK
jgi:DNA-binding protein H-NS